MTGDWLPIQNLGYSFNKTTWEIIKKYSEFFCTFDDYNWDLTLYRLMQICAKPTLATLAVIRTRVLHVGIWWVTMYILGLGSTLILSYSISSTHFDTYQATHTGFHVNRDCYAKFCGSRKWLKHSSKLSFYSHKIQQDMDVLHNKKFCFRQEVQ